MFGYRTDVLGDTIRYTVKQSDVVAMIVRIEYSRAALGKFCYCAVVIQGIFIVIAGQVMSQVNNDTGGVGGYTGHLSSNLCRTLDGYLHNCWYFWIEKLKCCCPVSSSSRIFAILVSLPFVIWE